MDDAWKTFEDERFAVRFRYPAPTPEGEHVERREWAEAEALRVHCFPKSRVLYFEVSRYPGETAPAEYARHRRHLEERFSDLVISDLSETTVAGRAGHAYSFSWSEGERRVLLVRDGEALYRVIYNPQSALNSDVLTTLEFRQAKHGA